MIRRFSIHFLSTIFMLGALGACGGTAEEATATDKDQESLNFSGVLYDAGTQCTVGGATMHCCPSGYAMIGARVDSNVFKCAHTNFLNDRSLDLSTQRNGMHACPYGKVMVGLHVGNNYLVCQTPVSPGVTSEYVDGSPGTQDSWPMHVCYPGSTGSGTYSGYAMSGIRVDQNNFTCAY